MVAASGRRLSDVYEDLLLRYGRLEMVEDGYGFTPDRRHAMHQRLFTDRDLPDFHFGVQQVSWQDGCKVYFDNGGWVTIRFSGTEPLLRVSCEMPTADQARKVSSQVAAHLGLV